jgi:hypothetical protein
LKERERGEGKNCELCFGFIAICLLLLVHAMETCSRGIRRSGGREDERDKGRLGVELVSEGLDTLLLLLGLGSVVDGLSKSGRGSVRRSKGSRRRGRVRGKEKWRTTVDWLPIKSDALHTLKRKRVSNSCCTLCQKADEPVLLAGVLHGKKKVSIGGKIREGKGAGRTSRPRLLGGFLMYESAGFL